jgi:hypothetical protein
MAATKVKTSIAFPAPRFWSVVEPKAAIALTLLVLLSCSAVAGEADWKPAPVRLMTRWAKEVGPDNVLPEYPRPQMVRGEWLSLNGLWQLLDGEMIQDEQGPPSSRQSGRWRPRRADGGEPSAILVPFPVESALSGQGKHKEHFIYGRQFEIPRSWQGRRIRLHFGAVDWQARVFVNDRQVGEHRGGYDPFWFDITEFLGSGKQQLYVEVNDPTDAGAQPHGKQHLKPEGIWYTPTTGIWQTVWLEPLPPTAIEKLRIQPDVDNSQVRLTVDAPGAGAGQVVEAIAFDGGAEVARAVEAPGKELKLKIAEARLWSPRNPFLYDLTILLKQGGDIIDQVGSYFGLRKVEVRPVEGITRIVLNDEPLFEVGPLDQGFWPDGLYTAPSDEALRFDIEMTKRLGFNMARKHVKVEPQRWYYWCDKLGLLVWQDMPHADHAPRDSKQFQHELGRMVENLQNHPAIVMWVVFNEGWGQHRTEWFTSMVKGLDSSRLVSNASGWNDKRVGDILDIHVYPGPRSPKPEAGRAAVLGEFGGLGLAVEGHVWTNKNWSYRGTEGAEQLTYAYVNLLKQAWRLRDRPGLSAAVYTQLTDVEGEINGLLTYERAVLKVDASKVAAANTGNFPVETPVLATSRNEPAVWKYTLQQPAGDWFEPQFNDAAWQQGSGGFGTQGTPGASARTTWNTSGIWLRRVVELPAMDRDRVVLSIHHDEDAEVYLNGVPAASVSGFTTDYEWVPLSREGRAALRPGKNVIAVHCKQTGGGQYIDLGLVELAWP